MVRNLKAGRRFQAFLRKGTYGEERFKTRFEKQQVSDKEDFSKLAQIDPIPKIVPRDYEKIEI